jgi:hypothetical protein
VADTMRPGDLIVAVCDNAHEELAAGGARPAADGTPGRGWLHWAVPDPVRADTDEAFEAAYTDLTHRVDRLAGALASTNANTDDRANDSDDSDDSDAGGDPATADRRSTP